MAALVRTALRSAVGCALRPLLGLGRGPLSSLLAGPPGGAAPGVAGPGPQPALGFKTKGVIKRRCKDCYRVKRRGRWFIYCKSNPRHKQRQM